MRRALKVSAWIAVLIVAFALLLAGAGLVAGNTASGRALIERAIGRLTGEQVRLSGLGGSFPQDLTLDRLQLSDHSGVWLTADRISLHWSPSALLERRVQVDRLKAARVDVERAPVSQQSGSVSVPHIEVAQFSIDVLQLGAELAGAPASLSVRGGARLRSLEDATADLVAHRTDSDGEYTLHLHFDPVRMDAVLQVHEPASGPLESILGLPGLGALSADVSLQGARDAERLSLVLSAGNLRASAEGSVDLRRYSADLKYALEASAMSPRADIAWRRIALNGHWLGSVSAPSADGRLEIDGLQLAGGTQIARANAQLTASKGAVSLRGTIEGLQIPGPQPQLLAKDPVSIDASMHLDQATRPLMLTAAHRLFFLRAQAVTAGQQSATLDLRLPNLSPFTALAGQRMHGDATIKGLLARRPGDVSLKVDASVGLSGDEPAWAAPLGKHVALQLSGALSGEAVSIERLRLDAQALTLSLSGSATRPGGNIEARWEMNVADLNRVVPELKGALQATGRLSGTPASLAADANLTSTLSIRDSQSGTVSAELHARGLPSAPNGTVQARGNVDGAPLELSVAMAHDRRGGLRTTIHHADWKSAHLEGEFDLEPVIGNSRGEVRMQLGQLGDLDRILGLSLEGSLAGSVGFTPVGGRAHAQFELDGRDLKVGQYSGAVHVTGEGDPNAVTVQLSAQTPDLYGAPANLSSGAVLNIDAREIRLASAAVDYRGQTLKLLSPAVLSLADGWSIGPLKLGAQDAVLQIEGQLTPQLNLHAALRHVKPALVDAFVPDLLAAGTIEGQLRLQGSLSEPAGELTVTASGLRSASGEAAGLPAIDVHASATLEGAAALVEMRANSNGVSLLSVSGSVPLREEGAVDLKILGKLDIGRANPLFEARGMHVSGQLTVDAAVTGSASAPQIHGAIALAGGSWRDYAHGMSLTGISAEVTGSEGMLQIKSFKATAASGTVTMTGSIGVLQPGVPVDLKIVATKAQPIASSIITANLNADIHISGTALERINIAGTIHVNRATVGIPDSLPPDVAVLDVRRRGQKVAAPVAKQQLLVGLDVAIQAPQEILVQGRGVDAELGGEVNLRGTWDAPQVTGGFDLHRGSFTIAGSKLTLTPPGRVSFDGAGLKRKIDPTLDFTTAQITVADATVYLHITGYADAPQFDFISNPPGLPQDTIMAYLLFGVSPSQLSALQLAQIGAAIATLTGVGGSGYNPLVALQKTLGLDRLSVGAATTTTATGATENTGAAIEAGRYVSKRVYVEAKQSTTGNSQVQVDIDLTKHLKLQTRLGNGTAITQGTTPENDPGSSIGLSYQFEY